MIKQFTRFSHDGNKKCRLQVVQVVTDLLENRLTDDLADRKHFCMAKMSEVSALPLYVLSFHVIFTTYTEIAFVLYFCFAAHDQV